MVKAKGTSGPRLFQAFQSVNYRLYFFGQSLSLIGTWMQRTAVYWLIFQLTQSAFILGVTAFCAQFPSFIFSILGGVVSDRYNRFNVLLTTQVASLIQAVILSILVYRGQHEVWHILTLSVLLGCINAFDVPARQALVYDMIDNKEHLPNAIALNSSMINIARLAGPAVAGLVLEKFGAEICFVSNGFSFMAVIISLLFMKLPAFQKRERATTVREDLNEGLTYLRSTPGIRKIIIMLACVSFLSLPYVTLLPVFADNIFHGSALTFGLLNTFVGLGAVTGALFLASLNPGTNLRVVLFRCTLMFGVGLMAFAYMESFYAALICMAVVGFGMMAQTTIANTIIQTTVAPTMRGRVISYYAMAFFGMQPIGGLVVGAIAHAIGAPLTMLCQGIATLLIAVIFFPFLRRDILMRKQRMKLKQVEEQIVENT
ncbi:MAG TPA: MFS transporter [Cyclobacteriaceae bacterium]|nr:MFS transporter [Cyclobacteriaceae bacterium]